MSRAGLKIISVEALARKTGILPGDRILRVNGHKVVDELDFRFFGDEEWLELDVWRSTKAEPFLKRVRRGAAGGLTFQPMSPKRCRNHCVFCFVDQLPQGLRKPLYFKDEDYRFSFLYGNYVTLASIKDQELDRVRRMRLSPLYISVHATDPEVRNFLLGRKASRDILQTIDILVDAGITLHAQVVLCPGINDGEVLENTVRDLARFYPGVASIAIVPVGLTRYRKQGEGKDLRRAGKKETSEIISKINELKKELKHKHEECFLFLSDEFYWKAGQSFPPSHEYGDFPQWENGVGMVPFFLRQVETRKIGPPWKFSKGMSFAVLTGELAYPYVLPYVERLRREKGVPVSLFHVRNNFLGRQVNVTGLITGRDIIKQSRAEVAPGRVLLIPEVVLNHEGKVLLDDVGLEDISRELGVSVESFFPDPAGFEKVLEQFAVS